VILTILFSDCYVLDNDDSYSRLPGDIDHAVFF
jgi:hypothetical protein